jgi:hypothetical protein
MRLVINYQHFKDEKNNKFIFRSIRKGGENFCGCHEKIARREDTGR